MAAVHPVKDFLYATDGRDAVLMEKSIASVKKHVPAAKFHLITVDYEYTGETAFESTLSLSSDEIKEYVKYKVIGEGNMFHWRFGGSARWFVQKMPHVKQCVFLDSDILCLKDPGLEEVEKIAAVPMQNFLQGRNNATSDYMSKVIPRDEIAYETGCMVMNVCWMRKVDFLGRIFNNAKKYQSVLRSYFFAENVLLSTNFIGEIEPLPLKYNTGKNDINKRAIEMKDVVFYHFHQEASCVHNKNLVMDAFDRIGGKIKICYVTDSSVENINRMEMSMKSVRAYNPSVQFYVVSTIPLSGDFINAVVSVPEAKIFEDYPRNRFSKGTMVRFFIPSSVNEDRVIYLDTDTLCLAPLDELWEETSKPGLGMVRYKIPDHEYLCELKRGSYGETYCNAGVIAMNLDSLRAVNFQEESFNFKLEKPMVTDVFYADETILNLKWKDIIHPVDAGFNVKNIDGFAGTRYINHYYGKKLKQRQLIDFQKFAISSI